jgi:hypothetical protein
VCVRLSMHIDLYLSACVCVSDIDVQLNAQYFLMPGYRPTAGKC